MGISADIDSHVEEFKKALAEAEERAMEAIGQQCVSHAIQELQMSPSRIDTGLLKNSITYALGGEAPAIMQYTADVGDGRGFYSGNAPSDKKNEQSVYIGTNVEYAIYVHEGTRRMTPNRFLRNAVENNGDEYKEIFKQELEKG